MINELTAKADRPGDCAVPSASLKVLYANLLQGMHAAAQPLTILRASLGKGQIHQMSATEYRELADSSATEVERLCTLFSYLQQLVITGSIQPHLCAMQISPLVAFVVEGVSLLFKEADMGLKSTIPGNCQPVLIDSARTAQALSSVLLTAHALAKGKDTIELAVRSSSDAVQLVVKNPNSYSGGLDPEASLSMALAEANIRSEHGSFSYSLEPFRVSIDLRRAPSMH